MSGGAPVVETLRTILVHATGCELPAGFRDSAALTTVGLTSMQHAAFLGGVEESFGFQWSLDTPSAALRNLTSMASYLVKAGVA